MWTPKHASMLAMLMAASTKMKVETDHNGMQMRPNHVYVIPPNASMELQDDHFTLTGFEREQFVRKSVADAGALVGWAQADQIRMATRNAEVVRQEDVPFRSSEGRLVSVEIVANRYMVGTRPVVQLNIRDIRVRKEAARALAQSENRFRVGV